MSMVALALVVIAVVLFLAHPVAFISALCILVAAGLSLLLAYFFLTDLAGFLAAHGADPVVLVVTVIGLTVGAWITYDYRRIDR